MEIASFCVQILKPVRLTGKILLTMDLGGIFRGRTEVWAGSGVTNRKLAWPITGRTTYGGWGHSLAADSWNDNFPSSFRGQRTTKEGETPSDLVTDQRDGQPPPDGWIPRIMFP